MSRPAVDQTAVTNIIPRASTPVIATSAISEARIEWTIRSLAQRPIWRHGCSPSPSRGGIVVSYETFALAGDVMAGHSLPPITMKGISREVIPYSVDNVLDSTATGEVIVERITGLDFYLDSSIVDAQGADRIRSILVNALAALDRRQSSPAQ